MEERENYTSLQEFTEELTPGGNSNGSQGLKRGIECLRSQTALLVLIGFLASICADIALTVLFKQCGECPEGWLHVGNQCYCFSNDKLDWLNGRDSCEEMGSHLTVLHTIEQHDALEKEVKRIGGFDYYLWIGLSDTEKGGDWRWVDNLTLQHRYWDQWSSELDNHELGGERGQDCATLDSHSKTWFDVSCDHIYKRICQMDAIPSS